MVVLPTSSKFFQLSNIPLIVVQWVRYDIPSEYRYYSVDEASGRGYWYVHEKYLLSAIELGYKQLGTVDYSCLPVYLQMEIAMEKEHWTVNQSRTKVSDYSKPSSLLDAYTCLHLLPSAPPEVVSSVWRSLAKLSHPDRGGDAETFRMYNDAYEVIKKEGK